MTEKTLSHHGILGMRWGVRRSPRELGYDTGSSRRRGSLNNKGKTNNKSTQDEPSVKKLTDAELREHISRLELEKRYKELLNADTKAKSNAGKAFVQNVLKKSGDNIATQLVTYGFGTAINKAFKADIVNPKKGQKDK